MEIPRKPGFPTAAAIKKGPGEIIRKMKKNSLYSSMRHLALACCIILQSIINLFQMVTQKKARNEVILFKTIN